MYAPIIVDSNNDGSFEVIATTKAKTSILPSNMSFVDLEILEIIPIQVVQGVDMVLGKTGLARVVVKNNGGLDANATVTMNLGNITLYNWDDASNSFVIKQVNATKNESFDFRFKPENIGTQAFSASVTVS